MIFTPIAAALVCLYIITLVSGKQKTEVKADYNQLDAIAEIANGAGITPAIVKRLFSEFKRLQKNGLAVCDKTYHYDPIKNELK